MHGLDPVLIHPSLLVATTVQLSTPDCNSAFNSSFCGSRQVHTRGCLIGAQPAFVFFFCFFMWWCTNACPFCSCTESEPRDAGTDQKSSGIIRLHTIKQIIDRVRQTHAVVEKRRRYRQIFLGFNVTMKRYTSVSGSHVKLAAALLC